MVMRFYYLPVILLTIYCQSWGQTLPPPADPLLGKAAETPPIELFSISLHEKPPAELPASTRYHLLTPAVKKIQQLYESSPKLLTLAIPQDKETKLILKLERVEILSNDFLLEIHTEGHVKNAVSGIHYRGHIAGRENALAAISIFPDEVTGLWRSDEMTGNWVLGGMKNRAKSDAHLLYQDTDLVLNTNFSCAMEDIGNAYKKTDLFPLPRAKNKIMPCIGLFFEVDYDVFRDKGGASNTIKYMTSLFNQIAAVFAQDDISVQLSYLYIWNIYSPYNGPTVEQQLKQFQEYRTDWQGDLAQLVNYKINGGVAESLDGLCTHTRTASMSYAGIKSTFSSIPNYSWTVNVTAHEFGHLMGARHTHACVWNGNGTSIDDCGNVYMDNRNNEPEGINCYEVTSPQYPQEGGTLMSYCHLLEGVGINLTKGFHAQPAAIIHQKIAEANCLGECTPQVASNICVGNIINLSLTLDDFGSETTWSVKDENGLVLYEGGPYADGLSGKSIEVDLCLGLGCYTFELLDTYGDGICCFFGNGAYTLTDTSGQVITQGSKFKDKEVAEFCLPIDGEAPLSGDVCQIINFNDLPINAYGRNQDEGDYEIKDEGMAIRLWGNAWKSIPLNYEVGPYTLLEFDFGSTAPAEIHAIGLDTDDKVSSNRTFKLFGSQNWGVIQYFHYEYPGEWMSFIIPVGMHFTGPVSKMFFCADDDIAPKSGDSWFRNIRLYESGDCMVNLADPNGNALIAPNQTPSIQVFPNPARTEIQMIISSPENGIVNIQLLNLMGQALKQKNVLASKNGIERLSVNELPRGTYLLRVEIGGEVLMKKVVLTR